MTTVWYLTHDIIGNGINVHNNNVYVEHVNAVEPNEIPSRNDTVILARKMYIVQHRTFFLRIVDDRFEKHCIVYVIKSNVEISDYMNHLEEVTKGLIKESWVV